MKINNWNGNEVDAVRSIGGVLALSNPFENLVSTGITPWPPIEIVQKLYSSRQSRAFSIEDLSELSRKLGYYSDLQSIHSEDAITWSVFGTFAYCDAPSRNRWIDQLLKLLGTPNTGVSNSKVSLWHRIPHPDNQVPGGPEIDVSIVTDDIVILGEAKWRSGIGVHQGKNKDKDQIQLRSEFLHKYGTKMFSHAKLFVVLGIGLKSESTQRVHTSPDVQEIFTTWDALCSIMEHPLHTELNRYLGWKKDHSKKG